MIKTIFKAIRGARELGTADVREYARGYLDEALESAGYARRGSIARALPIVGAFGAGVAVGTGLGVLVAPRSGKETREAMTHRLAELLETLQRASRREPTVATEDRGTQHDGPITPS